MSTKLHNFNGHKFSAKTGTTNDSKDGWMMGYSTQYAAGVWVGYHTRRVEMSGFMETMTRPIWQGWMNRIHEKLKPEERKKPGGVKTAPAYVIRSHVGGATQEPSPSTDLFPSWYNNNKIRSSEKRTIDIVSNKLATNCTPERAKKVVTELAADSFSADQFTGTGGANTKEKDDVHKCSDRKPSVSLTAKKNGNGTYDLVAVVGQGTHPLSSSKFKGKLTLSDGSQLAGGSYDVNAPGTFSYKNYRPSGNKTVTATIVDSVLYEDKDSVSVSGGSSSSVTLSVNNAGGNNYDFSWNTVSGASSYQLCISSSTTGGYSCSTETSTNVTKAVTGSNRKAYVKPNNGSKSNTTSF